MSNEAINQRQLVSQRTPIGSDIADVLVFLIVNIWVWAWHPRLVWKFICRLRRIPRVAVPKSMNDRIFWRRIFDQNPLFLTFSDKLQMKNYYREACPGIDVAEVLWEGVNGRDIPEHLLTQNVMIKCNSASRQNIVVDPDQGLPADWLTQTDRWMNKPNYGRRHGEWAYTQVCRRIFVEKMLYSEDGSPIININVHASDGTLIYVFMWVAAETSLNPYFKRRMAAFDPTGKRLRCHNSVFLSTDDQLPDDFIPPAAFWKACSYAAMASKEVDYARFDFFCGQETVHGGEITVYPIAGYETWNDSTVPDLVLQQWDLSKSWFLRTPLRGWRSLYAERLRRRLQRKEDVAERAG